MCMCVCVYVRVCVCVGGRGGGVVSLCLRQVARCALKCQPRVMIYGPAGFWCVSVSVHVRHRIPDAALCRSCAATHTHLHTHKVSRSQPTLHNRFLHFPPGGSWGI